MKPSQRTAFSLVELLVAMGIIVILLAMLFPLVGKLRKGAYGANTQQNINALQAAIQQYHATFQAYPGMFDWTKPVPARYVISASNEHFKDSAGGADINVTQAETLLLSLSGGAVYRTTPSAAFFFDQTQVGTGAMSLNPSRPRKYTAFAAGDIKLSTGDEPNYGDDTDVPEYVDGFPDAKPILYVRAHLGGALTADQYPPDDFGYGFAGKLGGANPFATIDAYLGDPSFTNQPRQKDQYVLISAGSDGIYGTKDDITNFGTPGK
jgi:type II secretory pathway pseudopilin PulG